nr:hypothetical protein B0A51_04776 [Rachicladosporium sp. CCFEE 5018]
MGVCCEPNMVFIVCNQFPLIGTRYTDVFNGTDVIGEVLPKYKAAWAKKGLTGDNGLFRAFYAPGQDNVVNAREISHSGWISAFLVWDQELTKRNWPLVTSGFLHEVDGRINIRPSPVANAIRDIVKNEDADPKDPTVVSRAQKQAVGKPVTARKYLGPQFGHVAQGMSEIRGSPDLEALLLHADTYLGPTWTNGGLHYSRRSYDQKDFWDDDGNYTYGEPHTGNACIGYARLNVKGGQRKMWECPWTREQVEKTPYVDGIDLGTGVDCLSGRWDEEKSAMFVALRTWHTKDVDVTAVVRNLPPGKYGVYVDGELKNVTETTHGKPFGVHLIVGGQDVELVLLQA